jgi:hypothetical protein
MFKAEGGESFFKKIGEEDWFAKGTTGRYKLVLQPSTERWEYPASLSPTEPLCTETVLAS